MQDNITLRGWVATDINSKVSGKGVPVVTFRLACPERKYNRDTDMWEDNHTSWYTVVAFKRLATHAVLSLHKGDRVIVQGRLRIREWTAKETKGIAAEIVSNALGHDLGWGTSFYSKNYGKKAEKKNAEKAENQRAELEDAVVEVETAGNEEYSPPHTTLSPVPLDKAGHYNEDEKTFTPCNQDTDAINENEDSCEETQEITPETESTRQTEFEEEKEPVGA